MAEVVDPDKVVIRKTVVETLKQLRADPKYATARPEDYRHARKSFADQWDLTPSDLTFRINSLADLWKRENDIWPRGQELLEWDTAQNSIWTFATGFSQFDLFFGIEAPDGSKTFFTNDPVKGISQDRDIFSQAPGVGAAGGDKAAEFIVGRTVVSEADLPAILAGLSPIRQPSGGGGGVGRKARSFDRRQLSEAATNRWRGLLLEDPEDAVLDRLVSDYITEANAFWVRDSGSLDFDTFVTDRIRAQDRHAFLYGKKPEFQSEAEYMGGFRQTVGQFGLNSRGELRELEAGASSGVGLAGFGERVSRTREARLINQGSFSQRLAGSLANSGLGGS
jgi:hypothetical protein